MHISRFTFAVASAVALAGVTLAAQSSSRMNVATYDDRGHKLAGVAVSVWTPTDASTHLTDADGVGEALDVSSGEPALMIFGETQGSAALALGQAMVGYVPDHSDVVGKPYAFVAQFHHPTATLTHIDSSVRMVRPADVDAWRISTPVNEPEAFEFDAFCGVLEQDFTIDRLFDFNQVALPHGYFQKAFLLRAVDPLGPTGAPFWISVVVSLEAADLDLTQPLDVSALVLAGADELSTAGSYTATIESVADGRVSVWMRGFVGSGDHLLLLSQGPGLHSSITLLKSPALLSPASSAPSSAGDCEPPKPTYSGPASCPPLEPRAVGCEGRAPIKIGSPYCNKFVLPLTPRQCFPTDQLANIEKHFDLMRLGQLYPNPFLVPFPPPVRNVTPPSTGPSPFGKCYRVWEHLVTCTQLWGEWMFVEEFAAPGSGIYTGFEWVGEECKLEYTVKYCTRAAVPLDSTTCLRTGP